MFMLSQPHSTIRNGTGLMPGNCNAATRAELSGVGSFSAAMAQSPSDSSPAEMLPGELETAKQFGARVVEVASTFTR